MVKKIQKERELKFVYHFKDLCYDFPSGKIVANDLDPPDILIFQGETKLGLEVTELFPKLSREEKWDIKKSSLVTDIIDKVKEKFSRICIDHFIADVFFRKEIFLKKSKIEELSERIYQSIKSEIDKNTNKDLLKVRISGTVLPCEVEAVNLIFHPNLTQTIWNIGGAWFLRDLDESEILGCIEKKNGDLLKKKLSFPVWLLIVEPHDRPCFDSIPVSLKYKGSFLFSKIFFLRTLSDELIEIKLSS